MHRIVFLISWILVFANGFAAEERALFTGGDLRGWRKPLGTWQTVQEVIIDPASARAFFARPGAGILLNSTAGKTVDALTETEHGDCELHIEFTLPKGSNSGVYLMGRYEVQIFDSFGKSELKYSDCGGLYQRDGKAGEVFGGKAPAVNVSKAPGVWQSFDIVFRAPRFDAAGRKTANARFVKVTHNGQVIHEDIEVDGPTRAAAFRDEKPLGPLKLQGDHGPVAFRNLRLKGL